MIGQRIASLPDNRPRVAWGEDGEMGYVASSSGALSHFPILNQRAFVSASRLDLLRLIDRLWDCVLIDPFFVCFFYLKPMNDGPPQGPYCWVGTITNIAWQGEGHKL
jgi:hypothetical protein